MKPITEFPYSPELLTDKRYFWNRKTLEELAQPTNGEDDHQALLAITQENRKLFRLIGSFVPTVHGWCSIEKACALAGLVLAMKPQIVVEIGTFGGKSFLPMVMALQHLGSGRAVGIDPYSKEASAAEEIGENATWWGNLDHESVMNQFLAFVKSFGLDSYVHLIRQKSDDVEPPTNMDILHIDGSHTGQAVRDAERYGPRVRLGGIAVADDTRWVGGGVLRAMDTLEDLGFTQLYIIRKSSAESSDDWAMFQRVKA